MISHRIDPDFSVSDLPAPFLSEAGLYPCPTCNDPNKVYASQANLDRHCRRFHPPSQSRLNSELLTALFPTPLGTPPSLGSLRMTSNLPPFDTTGIPNSATLTSPSFTTP
jgi:hypothetical protein